MWSPVTTSILAKRARVHRYFCKKPAIDLDLVSPRSLHSAMREVSQCLPAVSDQLWHQAYVSEAAGLLGYRWNVTGKVQQGKKLGRTLGFPTANLVLPDYTRLINGIYAVRVRRENGSLHDGVASFGGRPTFDNGAELFETFLFDFDDDLYGENITVSLFEFMRGEDKFSSAEALVEQMKKDEVEARARLAGVQPLSTLDGVLNFTA